jgi:hypothetical protein
MVPLEKLVFRSTFSNVSLFKVEDQRMLQLHGQKTVARDVQDKLLYGHGMLIMKQIFECQEYGIIQACTLE